MPDPRLRVFRTLRASDSYAWRMDRYGKRADLIVHEREPFNAETGLAALDEGPLTATDAFYVRGHGAVPEIDPAAWRLHVDGAVERELDLSFATLREAFVERTETATLQCAGNRRAGLMAIRDIPGEAPWGPGATGTATWTGVALADVLALAGPAARGRARRLRGRRPLPRGQAGPALRRLDPARQGVPPRGPARLGDERRAARARPRRAAARRRARLHRRAQRQVARAHRGPRDRRGRATSSTSPTGCCPRTARPGPGAGMPLGLVALNADVLSPADGETVAAGPVEVRGYAFAGGERHVARVDVSLDARRDLVAGRAARRPRPRGRGGTGARPSTSRPASTRSSSAPGTPRRPRSPRTRRRCGTPRAT